MPYAIEELMSLIKSQEVLKQAHQILKEQGLIKPQVKVERTEVYIPLLGRSITKISPA